MTDKEAPKQIWLNDMMSWSAKKMYDDDVKYVRADHIVEYLEEQEKELHSGMRQIDRNRKSLKEL